MSSIIEGYNYDIFISYRQKDNKGDKWVSDFVEALKTELESTFKEDISVYFDINPHDGLLETHDVDASLKDKLKCLIFIPIISRTYCDPKSFAWEHEFKAFVEQASKDQFGLKIKLPNGNVANRIIPVQIHDLYPEDKSLIEKELGGVLRAIEFIYKEPGVNKPLTAIDNEKKNLNNTTYRIQINKVANAIDEIFHSLRGVQASPEGQKIEYEQSLPHSKEQDKSKDLTGTTKVNQKSNKWLPILLSAALCIVSAFAVFKFVEGRKRATDIAKIEKSIAVLPFVNDSPDQGNSYFINGIMDEILNNLQKIKDFRVLSRTSVEKYRGQTKLSIPEIAKELNVNYIVEGSGQKYGNKFVLRVQLIAAMNEKHLWGEAFEREIKETSDIIDLQSQIAQTIGEELKTTFTPEEKEGIGKIPTKNLTAYDLMLRGDAEGLKYWSNYLDINSRQALDTAEALYKKALKYDSTFALIYNDLAQVYLAKHGDDSYLSENYLDSVLILANLALSFDDHLSEAYYSKGHYYFNNGNGEQAIKAFEQAIKYNPNFAEVYKDLGGLVYKWDTFYADYVKSLEYQYKALNIFSEKDRTTVLRWLGDTYVYNVGFPEKAKAYYQEAFKLDGDIDTYYNNLASLEIISGNHEKALELYNQCYARDSNRIENILRLGYGYYLNSQYKKSLTCFKKVEKSLEVLSPFNLAGSFNFLGVVYWMNGYKKEADHWFDKQRKFDEANISFRRGIWPYYDLAFIYAFKGDKQKALENLREITKIHICPFGVLVDLKTNPFFNSIRNEPEFQKIVSVMESKYQAEHERVRKWLEEQVKL